MADYIVKDTELTGVANSIRTAGGTSSLLTFPNGFISAINNISGGGGGSSDFSTTEVTVVNTTANFVSFGGFAIIDSNDYFSIGMCSADPNSSAQYQFVMYKGSTPYYYNANLFGASEAVGTGDIEIEEMTDPETGDVHWEVHITGDCTITIS